MEPYKIVTPEQYKRGYFVMIGVVAYQRQYQFIHRNEDGTITVANPEIDAEKEKARLKAEGQIP